MATVIGVRFKKAGKVYYFDPNGIWPRPGECVIVETARGVEFGEVVTGSRTVNDAQIVTPLKKVIRVASEEDIRRAENNEKREKEAFSICQDRIARHKLDMKLVSVEYTFDNSKIIFYFTSNGRVDFRDLVKDLASVFKIRIELRQIGVRDEAKMLGGLGSCGRQICCGAFLGDFQPVSIKMAKEQNLSLNPTKISGQCGRLMCCLKYEQENYEQVLKRVPRVGKDVVTPDGVGVITEINCIKETIKVRIRMDDDSFDVKEYAIDDVRRPGPDDAAAIRETPKDRHPRRGRPQPEPAPEAEENGEDAKKKRYPHQKAPKNLSTDQFLEKLKENGGATPVPAREQREPKEAKEPREPREPKEPREPREPKEAREPREPREGRESREPREPREPREGREHRRRRGRGGRGEGAPEQEGQERQPRERHGRENRQPESQEGEAKPAREAKPQEGEAKPVKEARPQEGEAKLVKEAKPAQEPKVPENREQPAPAQVPASGEVGAE